MNVPMERDEREERATAADRGRGLTISITPRSIWLAAGIVVLGACVAIVLINALTVLMLLFIAIILAEGIRPLVDWLQLRRVPRPLGVLLVYLGILLVVLGLAYLLVAPFIAQATNLSRNLPRYVAQVQQLLNQAQSLLGQNRRIAAALAALESNIGAIFSGIAPLLLQIPLMFGQLLFGIVVVVAMAFFWLTGIEQLKPFIVGLFPAYMQSDASDVLTEIGHRIGGYLRGVVINMFVIGILSGAVDFFLGIPYPLLLGIFAGLMESIPYFGPWISGGAALLVALIAVGPLPAVEVIIAYIVIQELEGNLLVPYVMMRSVDLNPLTVIIAVLLGTSLLGIIGGVLAVPLTVVVKVLIVRVVGPIARQSSARLNAQHKAHESASSPSSRAS